MLWSAPLGVRAALGPFVLVHLHVTSLRFKETYERGRAHTERNVSERSGSSEVIASHITWQLNFIPFLDERGRPNELSGTGRGYSGAFVDTHVDILLRHIL